MKHLRRAHTTAQEIFNYLSITLNKTNSVDNEIKNKILSQVSDMKKYVSLKYTELSLYDNFNSFINYGN